MENIKIEKYKLLEFINNNIEFENIKVNDLNDYQLKVLYMLISYNINTESLNNQESNFYKEFIKIDNMQLGKFYIDFVVADYIINFFSNGSIGNYTELLEYMNNLMYDYNKLVVEFEEMEILY